MKDWQNGRNQIFSEISFENLKKFIFYLLEVVVYVWDIAIYKITLISNKKFGKQHKTNFCYRTIHIFKLYTYIEIEYSIQ